MKTFMVAILLIFAASITDASAQSTTESRNVYYGGVFIDHNGTGLRTLDGGTTWTEVSPDEVKKYLSRQGSLINASATASVSTVNEMSIGVHPNPANSIVTVTSDELLHSEGTIRLFDMRGAEVLMTKLVSGQSSSTLDLSGLPAGQYRYVCTINGKSSNGGIVVH